MLNIFMVYLDPWIKSPPFFMPPGHFTKDQIYGLKINDHQLFSPQAHGTEVNYCPSLILNPDNLSDQEHIPGIQDKWYNSRLSERHVYWKQDEVSESYTDCLAISTSISPLEMETLIAIMGKEGMTDLAYLSCAGVLTGDGS